MSEMKPNELLVRFPLSPGEPTAWSIRLAAPGGLDGFGRERPWDLTDPLTPDQAEAYGVTLESLIAGLNADAMKERDALLSAYTAALARIEALTVERDALIEKDQDSAESPTTGAL